MKKAEFDKAWEIAKNEEIYLDYESLESFDGYGLSGFEPVYVTIKQIARLIRWQCQYINGGWNYKELNEIGRFGKRRFMILN